MKIIFLGTPEFALPSLEKLYSSRHEILAVVTQMDKPAGRGNKLTASPVKAFAVKNAIKVLQYEKISRDGLEELKSLNPDLMITAAYGQILSQAIIDIPKYGIINVHGSLLPKYRGASPVQTAVLNGDEETGITIMQTEAGLDTGDILSVVKTKIGENETAGELMNRLAILGSDLLLETLDKIEDGTITRAKQQHADATITKKINKDECIINWNKSAKQIKCLIHGANPDPIARTLLNDVQVKIYRAKIASIETNETEPGTIISPSSAKAGVFVKCGQGVIEIVEAQLPGGKVLTAKQLFGGRKFAIGMRFEPVVFPSNMD
ncbi:MAG: methionyl-tRNA formyltransferase [Clostridia bacterium]|nr:methionyl-tRNA formyltransferase [Clostridia bacterium]